MDKIINYIKNFFFYTNFSPTLTFKKKSIFIKKIPNIENVFLLRTMTKSGSHYFISIIGNYILRKYLKKKKKNFNFRFKK